MRDGLDEVVSAVARLHRAGWSIGDVVFQGDDRKPRWLVSGSNGDNLIRAEGSTPDEAWAVAEDQARSLGMIRLTPREASPGWE